MAIYEHHIVWSSEVIGEVEVPKDEIKSLYTSVPLKMPGEEEVCYWLEKVQLDVKIQCGNEERQLLSLAGLKNIFVFERYDEVAHDYQGKMVGTGTISDGNRVREDWLWEVDITLRHYDYRHKMELKFEAESQDDEALEKEYEAIYELDWFFVSRTFLYFDAQGRRDESRDIDARYSLGSGFGYQFWDTNSSAFSVSSGLEYVYEALAEETDSAVDQSTFGRLATSYRFLFPRNIGFYLRSYFLQSVSGGADWEVEAEAGISLPIARGITTDVRYEFDFDNTPAEDLSEADSRLRFGFGYEW